MAINVKELKKSQRIAIKTLVDATISGHDYHTRLRFNSEDAFLRFAYQYINKDSSFKFQFSTLTNDKSAQVAIAKQMVNFKLNLNSLTTNVVAKAALHAAYWSTENPTISLGVEASKKVIDDNGDLSAGAKTTVKAALDTDIDGVLGDILHTKLAVLYSWADGKAELEGKLMMETLREHAVGVSSDALQIAAMMAKEREGSFKSSVRGALDSSNFSAGAGFDFLTADSKSIIDDVAGRKIPPMKGETHALLNRQFRDASSQVALAPEAFSGITSALQAEVDAANISEGNATKLRDDTVQGFFDTINVPITKTCGGS